MKRGIITMIHKKCRNSIYPSSNIQRFTVPDDKISWDVNFPEYSPVIYSSRTLQGKSWADPSIEDESFKPKWNQIDDNGNLSWFLLHYFLFDSNLIFIIKFYLLKVQLIGSVLSQIILLIMTNIL